MWRPRNLLHSYRHVWVTFWDARRGCGRSVIVLGALLAAPCTASRYLWLHQVSEDWNSAATAEKCIHTLPGRLCPAPPSAPSLEVRLHRVIGKVKPTSVDAVSLPRFLFSSHGTVLASAPDSSSQTSAMKERGEKSVKEKGELLKYRYFFAWEHCPNSTMGVWWYAQPAQVDEAEATEPRVFPSPSDPEEGWLKPEEEWWPRKCWKWMGVGCLVHLWKTTQVKSRT